MFSPPVKAKKQGNPLRRLEKTLLNRAAEKKGGNGCSYRLRSCWNRTLMPLEFSTVRPKLRSST